VTAEEYLRQVEFRLRDLPWKARRELVSELRGHLSELPVGELASLGTPEEYAADLRSAAGLEPGRGLIAFLRARRPRNLILTAVALTVLGLAIGGVAWVDSYQPLVFGNGGMDPEHVVYPPTGGAYVVARKGRPFRLGFTVRNDGRFTVRILGVPTLYGYPFRAHLWASGPTRNGGMPLPERRFQPIDLKPGWTLALYLVGRYACTYQAPAGSSTTLGALPVQFSFLWRTATTTIVLADDLTLLLPKHAGCPSALHPPPSMP
jgi:HAAS domain-containing protein